jgi:hypothetical protein
LYAKYRCKINLENSGKVLISWPGHGKKRNAWNGFESDEDGLRGIDLTEINMMTRLDWIEGEVLCLIAKKETVQM